VGTKPEIRTNSSQQLEWQAGFEPTAFGPGALDTKNWLLVMVMMPTVMVRIP